MPLWENKNRSSDTPKFTTDASSGKTGTGEYYDEVFGFDAKPIQQPRRVKVEPAGFVLNMSMVVHAKKC